MQVTLKRITRETVAFGRPLDFVATVCIDGAPEWAVCSNGEPDGISFFENIGERLTLGEMDAATADTFDRLTVGGMSVDPTFHNLCIAMACGTYAEVKL